MYSKILPTLLDLSDKMIIVHLKGGLGNQLFQYAAGRTLAYIHNTVLKLDTTAYYYGGPRQFELYHFNIQENIAVTAEVQKLTEVKQNRLQKLLHSLMHSHPKLSLNHFRYNKMQYNPDFLKLPDNVYLEGYWLSEKYFSDIKDIIRREFTFKHPPDETNRKLADHISAANSVSIHIRLGDYITDLKTGQTHGICGLDYYHKSIEELSSKINQPHFFVFSDNMDWCRNKLKVKYPVNYVDHNPPDRACEDLRLMSLCKHHIIANSTFSWWGAWLAANKNKMVFAPEKWFARDDINTDEILPNDWIRVKL